MDKLQFTSKQKILMRMFRENKLKRINILQGSVRSGKTWISLILWALWVASRPKDYPYMMCAKSLSTLERNCLLPLQELVGENNFTYSYSAKKGKLFGRKILLEGAYDKTSENKIRGVTLGGAYCDEITLFNKEFFIMLLSRLSVAGAKLIGTTNPDSPMHWLKTEYLDNVKLQDDLLSMFFHIDDNTTLPEEYIRSLKLEYSGVFYDRFILGLWKAAQGAIYLVYSNNPTAYAVTELPRFEIINIGVDFGGNGSAHAIVASGITADFGMVYVLRSERKIATHTTPQQLDKWVYDFCADIKKEYGFVTNLYADSAEQLLISGLRNSLKPLEIKVKNSLKREINDRIHATTRLMGAGRFKLVEEHCKTLSEAFQGAVWDDTKIGEDVRLDNGTSDIDTLDAFEYSIERHIQQLIKER